MEEGPGEEKREVRQRWARERRRRGRGLNEDVRTPIACYQELGNQSRAEHNKSLSTLGLKMQTTENQTYRASHKTCNLRFTEMLSSHSSMLVSLFAGFGQSFDLLQSQSQRLQDFMKLREERINDVKLIMFSSP